MMAGLWDHEQGGIMSSPSAPWPPREGDAVRIKEVGLVGTVIKTKGVYEARFHLKISPPTAGGRSDSPKTSQGGGQESVPVVRARRVGATGVAPQR